MASRAGVGMATSWLTVNSQVGPAGSLGQDRRFLTPLAPHQGCGRSGHGNVVVAPYLSSTTGGMALPVSTAGGRRDS